MPYIKQEQRPDIDKKVQSLVNEVVFQAGLENPAETLPGILNYTITKLLDKTLSTKFGKLRYFQIAMVAGVLSNVESEFYRRLAAPYEDQAMNTNGDAYRGVKKKERR